jgi:hypothetical protein
MQTCIQAKYLWESPFERRRAHGGITTSGTQENANILAKRDMLNETADVNAINPESTDPSGRNSDTQCRVH